MYYHHSFLPFGIGWGFALILLVPYFLPTIIAFARHKSSAAGIFILNFFLGWTLIGWVGALVWSLTSDRPTTVIVNNPPSPPPQTPGYTNVTVRKPSAPPPTQQDKIDQLRQLKQLLDEGVLTEEEFNRQKAAILG